MFLGLTTEPSSKYTANDREICGEYGFELDVLV